MSQTNELITLYIDDQKVQCAPGTSIIEAADNIGVYIPRFCYHEKLTVVASCRMCLVEIENAPKTLPACATPVANDMRVYTRSKKARESQKNVMEFLLINHPLDCPICDQGGECELQDIAMGYGEGVSRFTKEKRVVYDEDLGPLVGTDMTRCIHCTRCVRFGTEIAGIEELGAVNRGNHMKIGTYLKKGLKSELSGNVIDLCPVGALTSKPYRFQGRSWGFTQHSSISPHDCMGSNLHIHSINTGNEQAIMRVVPRKNDSINETWISDRDRFSYEGIQHKNRLTHPLVKQNGQWKKVSWSHAISYTTDCIQQISSSKGPDQIGALAHPSSTNEEFYLLQKLMRAIGSNNVDFRLKEEDFSDQLETPYATPMHTSIKDISSKKIITLIGANPRFDQPLFNHHLRKAVTSGATCIQIDSHLANMNYPVDMTHLVPNNAWTTMLAELTSAICILKKSPLPKLLEKVAASDTIQKLAKKLCKQKNGMLVIGKTVLHHPQASNLKRLLREITTLTGHTICYLPDGANTTGAAQMGMLPFVGEKQGLHAKQMIDQPRSLYWLHNLSPDHDMSHSLRATHCFKKSFVIACQTYDDPALREYADIILPSCTFAEMAGTYTNIAGMNQHFNAAITPVGDSKAGWKIIAAIAQSLGITAFDYPHSQAVIDEYKENPFLFKSHTNQLPANIKPLPHDIMWLSAIHPYSIDPITRHAKSLQTIAQHASNDIHMNTAVANTYQVKADQHVTVQHGKTKVTGKVIIDERVADQTIIIPNELARHFPKHCPLELRECHD